MAGIYLHIPFCKQACTYCNFHFTTTLRDKDDLVQALLKEIEDEKDYLKGESIKTIYFGGGTPSLLETKDIEKIINHLYKFHNIESENEITLEANPDDIQKEKLIDWQQAGINRLSIGIQSFIEEELRWMNRAHNSEQALRCIELSQEYGISNLNIDLIYGSPLLSDKQWESNINIVVQSGISHLSCYALTVEEKTPLYHHILKGIKPEIDTDQQARQFLLLMYFLKEKGYEHYEVSNFALPGYRSKHNSSYWKGDSYLGIGPSAHSYNGSERRWNISNNALYINKINNEINRRDYEILTEIQKLNEYIMISLRTSEGMDLIRIETDWGKEERTRIENCIVDYREKGYLHIKETIVQLTHQGILLADGIASQLFHA